MGRISRRAFMKGSLAAGVGLIIYECYFLKKTKGLSYI